MASISHIARKRFGQNFLKDPLVLSQIVGAFAPRKDENIVEIGPGLGALTELLLNRVEHLSAIELDRDLADRLIEQYSAEKLTLYQADVLNFDFSTLIPSDDQKIRVIGNLPYNISTPLIFHLLSHRDFISDMLFMLQKEVAERICAQPGSKTYGKLSVMAALDLHAECLFDVPPSAFTPAPKVNSTIIQLIPKASPPVVKNRSQLNQVVSAAFSQRRKTLRNALKTVISVEGIESAGINPGSRAEQLSIDDFIAISEQLR